MRKRTAASGTVIHGLSDDASAGAAGPSPMAIWHRGQVTWAGTQVSSSGIGTLPQAARPKARPASWLRERASGSMK